MISQPTITALDRSIAELRASIPEGERVTVADSGGKDSVCTVFVAQQAGLNFRRAAGKRCTWQDGTDLFFWWLLTSQNSYTPRDVAAVRALADDWGWRTGASFTAWLHTVDSKTMSPDYNDEEDDIDFQGVLIFE